MATSKGHNLTEFFDSPEELARKVDALAELIRNSEHFVAFTGAGVSTAAKIPDFRGPTGVWTMRDQGKRARCDVTMEEARPTYTHMALVEMQNRGVMKYLVSQNVDGLHRRSGIEPDKLSELHGNCFMETCLSCKADVLRVNDVTGTSSKWNGSRFDHRTGNKCAACGGELADNIIHFGENLPERALKLAFSNARKADVMLCIGSSLLVTPAANVPQATALRGKHLVIINLQETGLDGDAEMIIHGRCDEVMAMLMARLDLTPAVYRAPGEEAEPEDMSDVASSASASEDEDLAHEALVIGNEHESVAARDDNSHKWTMFVRRADGEEVRSVDSVTFHLHPTFTPQRTTVKAAPFSIARLGWGTFQVKVDITFKHETGRAPVQMVHQLSFARDVTQAAVA